MKEAGAYSWHCVLRAVTVFCRYSKIGQEMPGMFVEHGTEHVLNKRTCLETASVCAGLKQSSS